MNTYIAGMFMKIVGIIAIVETSAHIDILNNRLLIYAISTIIILIGDVMENQSTQI